MENSGTDVPVYGTNSMGAAQQHHNIFDMYQSFLGHFWGKDRTGMGDIKGMSGMLDQVFPGISNKVDQAGTALSDSNNPISQIFGSLSGKLGGLG